MNLFSFLFSAVGPLVVKILVTVGISVLTLTGVESVLSELVAQVRSGYGGLPGAVLGLADMAGVGVGLGLILGAFNARLAMWLAASATKFVLKGAV